MSLGLEAFYEDINHQKAFLGVTVQFEYSFCIIICCIKRNDMTVHFLAFAVRLQDSVSIAIALR